MSNLDDIFSVPALTSEDQEIVEAYAKLGVPLDDLPYTKDFERLGDSLGVQPGDREGLHRLFKRLLTLRKNGRLPRIYANVA